MDEPDPDTYGRVTNPERYAVLHAAADEIVGQLVGAHAVESTSDVIDERLALVEVDRMVRLQPAGSGAPLVLAWSSFPGIFLLAGLHGQVAFPRCGCDACDEDPAQLVEDLQWHVQTIVQGGYQEQVERRDHQPGIQMSFNGRGGGRSSWTPGPTASPSPPTWTPW